MITNSLTFSGEFIFQDGLNGISEAENEVLDAETLNFCGADIYLFMYWRC